MITSHDPPPRIRAAHTPIQRRRSRGRSRLSAPRRPQAVIEEIQDPHEIPDKPQLPKLYTIRFDRAYVEAVLHSYESKGHLTLKFDRLKYHPFLVTREIKPIPTLKSILANNNNHESKSVDSIPEPEVETPDADPEVINHGQDKATLELVARLAEEGEGVRSLRKRASIAPDSEGKRLRTRLANTVVVESPRRSMRATATAPTANAEVDLDLDLDGDWEVEPIDEDLDEDAEGEEYEE